METKHQVFVSSTYEDLREERNQVIQALLQCDCIPVGMELFPAADDEQWEFIKDVIDECDYFIVILGGRYGSCDAEGVSYTQREYEYASQKGKPIIGFTHSDPRSIPVKKVDTEAATQQKLEDFRGKVRKKLCKSWANPTELGLVVTQSIVQLKKRKPAVGWVRANQVASSDAAAELLRLRMENETLKANIDQLARNPPPGSELLIGGRACMTVSCKVLRLTTSPDREVAGWGTSWDHLFKIIGPHMLGRSSEADLREALNEALETFFQGADSVSIFDESFQQIKVQFMALGLIQLSGEGQAQHAQNDGTWTLTPYGRHYLMTLMAIKKPVASNASGEDCPRSQ